MFKIVNKYKEITVKGVPLALLLLLVVWQGDQPLMAQDSSAAVPDSFVELRERIPSLQLELRYFGDDNFVGRVIDGYRAEKVYMTVEAANALAAVQDEFAAFGLSLKVYDAYRPQQAVDHFVRWAKDLDDKINKAKFYPDVAKENLFSGGYIAERSGHSRGSTVDLTLVNLEDGSELDMGTPWDFFDPSSWPSYLDLPVQVRANRNLLASVMTKHGFKALTEEWWHFTLANEPYPDTYFDFPIE